jgi:hypothetical protein
MTVNHDPRHVPPVSLDRSCAFARPRHGLRVLDAGHRVQMMSDSEMGKRMVEQMMLEQILPSYSQITGKEITNLGADNFERVEGSPDFIEEFDGRALGIEIAAITGVSDTWGYYEEASRIAWQKHESYLRRGLFKNPIVLILHSDGLPLFDIRRELKYLVDREEFEGVGFGEVWSIDFDEAYFTPGHPFRLADMFCFKPRSLFGFHRIGGEFGRKPYG